MRRPITLCLVLFLMSLFCFATYAQQVTVAFIGEKANMANHNKSAYEWAQKTYQAPLIATGDIAKSDLTKYAVIWWHEGEVDPTPKIKECADALMKYVVNGGTLLLSAAAEKLATDLGVESGTPRSYAKGADGNKAGVTIRKDTIDHPVWEGFKRAEGEKIELTTLGFPTSSDYWSRTYKDAVNVGNCWETPTDWTDEVGGFVEWSNKNTGKGLVFGMGWRLAHWTEDNKDRPSLEKMTTNIFNYLASKSAYFAVNPSGSLVTTWGEMKQR